MNLVSLRIITADIARLVRFYERVTGTSARMYTDDFGELATPAGTLAIGSTRSLTFFGDAMAQALSGRPSADRPVIIEFRVADVDVTYESIADAIADTLVQPPTTMPWGNRSLLFRDPDGNLVNFFTPVTPEAIARLDG